MRNRKRPRHNDSPALKEKEGGDLWTHLPISLLQHIDGFFSEEKRSKTLAGLAGTSNRFHTLFQPVVQGELNKTLFNLFDHIVHGEPNEVYIILDKHPSLLLHTFTVTDPAGYTITATPYRAALCCQDPQIATGIQWRLIKHAGIDEVARQWDAQFPAGWEEAEKERWKLVFTQLKKLDKTIRAAEEKDISADQNHKLTVREGSAVERELKEFQRLLRVTRDEPIKIGRTFNPHFLQKLADHSNRYCYNFGVDNPKHLLFCQRVYGYAQRFLSAPDAQAFVDGVDETKNKLEKRRPQVRSLKINKWDPVSQKWMESGYYSCAGLGFDFAIFSGGIATSNFGVSPAYWRAFISQKQALFKNLCHEIRHQIWMANVLC